MVERRSKPWLAALFSTGDVVHDVFLQVLRGMETFDGGDADLRHYLAKAVTHRVLDYIRFYEAARRDGRRLIGVPVGAATAPARDADSPNEAAVRREEAALLAGALGALRPRDRQLLDLRLKQSKTYEGIAIALGLPSADAARKASHLAQARLLVALRARGIDD